MPPIATAIPEQSYGAEQGGKSGDEAAKYGREQERKDADNPRCLLSSDGKRNPCPAPPPPEEDDPVVDPNWETQLALGDALKPIIKERLAYAADPGEIQKAYEKAYGDDKAGLKKDYDDADEKFRAIAKDLVRIHDDESSSRLGKWIEDLLDPGKPIERLFREQAQVRARLVARSGPRECRRSRAEEKTRRWQKAHEDWKSPGAKIKAIIDGYKDKLAKVGCEAHSGDPYAIYQFWFEIAPQHLSLRTDAVRESNAPGISLICRALENYPERRRALASATERRDGSFYLVPTVGLNGHRCQVLDRLEEAVKSQVEADVAFKLRPDSAAALKPRLETLIQTERDKIKKQLETPA